MKQADFVGGSMFGWKLSMHLYTRSVPEIFEFRRRGFKATFSAIVMASWLALISPVYAVSIDWDNLGVGNLTSIATGQVAQSLDDAGNCVITPPFTDCEVEATITWELNNDGNGGQLDCGFGANSCVRYYNDQIGGITDGDLRLGVNATAADGGDDDMRMCVEFNREVEGLQFDVLDIDDASWDDSVEITYVPFVNSTPILARADLVNAIAFGDVTTGTDPNHVIAHDPANAAPDNEVLGWGAIQNPPAGNANAGDDGGNVSIDFGTQQVGGFCIRYFAGPNSNGNPGFQWIALSQLTWTTTLPVDLAHVDSSKIGRFLTVEWSTSAESFNLGFNLWGEKDGEWFALTRNMLASNAVDSMKQQSYEKRVRLSRELSDITQFGLSSVDALGNEEFYGPFTVGERYGEAVLPAPIDWQSTVAQHAERMQARGFTLHNGRWKRTSSSSHVDAVTVRADVDFSESGIARVNHRDLLAAGLDLRGVHKNQIAVSHRGNAIVRRIGKTVRGVFGEDSYIDFYAAPLDQELALYNSKNTFQISQEPNLVRRARAINVDDPATKVSSFSAQTKIENDALYLNLSKAGSPWMEKSYGLGAVKTTELLLPLPEGYLPGTDLSLEVNLHGGFDHPAIEDDHLLKIHVNGQEQAAHQWAGIAPATIEVPVSASVLSTDEQNIVTLEGVSNSAGFALQYLDNYSIQYAVDRSALIGMQGFTLGQDGDHLEFLRAEVSGAQAYAVDDTGNFVRLRRTHAINSQATDRASRRLVQYARSSDENARYYVLKDEDFLSPVAITSVAILPTLTPQADLYIIAHPSFIGEELQAYADHKTALGITTEIVDYSLLREQIGHGFNDPFVIREFLRAQQASVYGSSALLVGGHSFDYLDLTGQGSISFIPTAYRQSSVIAYSPTDTPFTDTNGDGLSDVPIGRWPVRTLDDLSNIIAKSTAWGNGEGLASSDSVLLLAEKQDLNNGISFSQQLDDLSARFDPTNEHQGGFWGSVTRLYAADFLDSETPNADHKFAMQSELESGHGLTVFNGHGSTNSWTYSGLFRVSDIDQIQDQGKASIYFPLACYTTYYESISNDTLAHQLLFKPNGGAVMIVGAATLGDYTSNGRIFDRVMQFQVDKGTHLGRALMLAKQAIKGRDEEASNLWTMLGDPTLRFNSDYVKPAPVSEGVGEVED